MPVELCDGMELNQVGRKWTLSIPDVISDDEGKYEVCVTNKFGTDRSVIHVKIQKRESDIAVDEVVNLHVTNLEIVDSTGGSIVKSNDDIQTTSDLLQYSADVEIEEAVSNSKSTVSNVESSDLESEKHSADQYTLPFDANVDADVKVSIASDSQKGNDALEYKGSGDIIEGEELSPACIIHTTSDVAINEGQNLKLNWEVGGKLALDVVFTLYIEFRNRGYQVLCLIYRHVNKPLDATIGLSHIVPCTFLVIIVKTGANREDSYTLFVNYIPAKYFFL